MTGVFAVGLYRFTELKLMYCHCCCTSKAHLADGGAEGDVLQLLAGGGARRALAGAVVPPMARQAHLRRVHRATSIVQRETKLKFEKPFIGLQFDKQPLMLSRIPLRPVTKDFPTLQTVWRMRTYQLSCTGAGGLGSLCRQVALSRILSTTELRKLMA